MAGGSSQRPPAHAEGERRTPTFVSFSLLSRFPNDTKLITLFDIRQAQMDELSRIAFHEFHLRLEGHLRAYQSGLIQGIMPETLSRKVEEALVIAREHQIEIELDICEFVVLTFQLGPRFDLQLEYAWAKEILSDREMSPAVKIMQIKSRMANSNQPLPSGGDEEIE